MALRRYILFLFLAIVLLPGTASDRDPSKVVVNGKRDPSEVVIRGVRDPSSWFRIESQHFVIYSDSDREQAVDLANNLERLDYVLRMYLKPYLIRQAEPPKLVLSFRGRFGWPAGLGEFPVETTDIIESCVSATQGFTFSRGRILKSTNASLLHDDGDFTLGAIFSLYTQNFLYRHTDIRGPEWFIEGFQFYFGGVRFTDNQMVLGRPAPFTADSLKTLDEGPGHIEARDEAVSHGAYLSYDQVLRKDVPPDFFSHMRSAERNTGAYFAQAEFQSRAFTLAHYMLSSAENRDKMGRYLELVNNGADGGTAFDEVFGLSGIQLNQTMWHYRRVLMKVIKVDFPELPSARIGLTRLSRIEGDFVLDNAVAKACPSPGEGKRLLERVQALAPKASAVDFAQVTLSRAQVEWGDPRDALPWLTAAVKRDTYDEERHYLLGLADLKLAESATGDQRVLLRAARSSLKEAALLAPGAPSISYALFRVGLLDPDAPLEQTMLLAVDAWRQGHDVPAFGRAAALAQAWLGDAAGAYQTFNTLARTEHDAYSARFARKWLALLEKGVARDELLAAMRDDGKAPPSFRQQFGEAR